MVELRVAALQLPQAASFTDYASAILHPPTAALGPPVGTTLSPPCCCCLQYDGETAVKSEVSSATIFRPALMTGTEDKFFNNYAQLVKRLPFVPLIDGGDTKLQPVWVRDVADGE